MFTMPETRIEREPVKAYAHIPVYKVKAGGPRGGSRVFAVSALTAHAAEQGLRNYLFAPVPDPHEEDRVVARAAVLGFAINSEPVLTLVQPLDLQIPIFVEREDGWTPRVEDLSLLDNTTV